MAKIKMVFLSIALAAVLPFSALAGNYVKLGESKKASSVQTLGYIPKKKKSELKLGNLRTEEAELPPGKLTLTGRMKLRAKRALQRQRAVSRARRTPQSTTPPPMDADDPAQDFNQDEMSPDRKVAVK